MFNKYSAETLKSMDISELPYPVRWHKLSPDKKLFVEIGSGHGEVLGRNNQEESIMVGFELKNRYFRIIKQKIRKKLLTFVYRGDAYKEIQRIFADNSIDKVIILFPDPWHKEKHKKRRPINAKFFSRVHKKLARNGQIIVATDWEDYAQYIEQETRKVTNSYNITIKPYVPSDFDLPPTHYYKKWSKIGRKFTAFSLIKR
jgi:tRNA (guanine-N7-)-methyltransferase